MTSDTLNKNTYKREKKLKNDPFILFFFFILRWVATCPIFHFFLFFVFRSPVNEENQDGVMHVDGKGQKDVYVVLQAHKSSLIILRES